MMPLGHLGIPLLVPIIGKKVRIDVRLLLLGSILPDIIDKPLGHLLLPGDNGRIFAHTLLFAVSILLIGFIWKPVLSLSLGVSFHHILDGMFRDLKTSFWPLLGPFESYDFNVSQWFDALLDPYVITEEIIGVIIIVMFVANFRIFNKEKLQLLLKKGRINSR